MKTQDRTIRDVKIGDILQIIYESTIDVYEVVDVGQYGFVTQRGIYYTFNVAENMCFTFKQPEKQETVEEEKKRLKEEGYSLFPGGIYVKFPENFAENLKISSSCGGSEDCGSTSCSQHSKPEKQEIERTPVNESYRQQGYGDKYSLIDVAHKLYEVIDVVNKLLKE